jgi:Ribbon-helix-helix protein, copG family
MVGHQSEFAVWAILWIEAHSMETIQIVLDTKLLKAADTVAKRQKLNRSALIREALRGHLKKLHDLELEDKDRRGYLAKPQGEAEVNIWESAASWPED